MKARYEIQIEGRIRWDLSTGREYFFGRHTDTTAGVTHTSMFTNGGGGRGGGEG